MKPILRLAAWTARILPLSVKQWIYHFPPLAKFLRWSLNQTVPGGLTEVVIAAGKLAGAKMKLNLQTEKDYWLGTYEPNLQAAAVELIKNGMTIYDIGANIGYISLLMAKLCAPDGQVFSFEALPNNFKRLEENIRLNELENKIHVQPMAVVDKTDQVQFLIHSSTSMGKASGSAGRAEKYNQKIYVQGIAIDDFIFKGHHASPKIIKMDIEGGEVLAMKGMQRTLKELRPIFLIELHGREAAGAVWKALNQNGYSISEIRKGYPKVDSLDQLDWKAYIIAKPQ